jgi:predicted helicase
MSIAIHQEAGPRHIVANATQLNEVTGGRRRETRGILDWPHALSLDNITDNALEQFLAQYPTDRRSARPVTKDAIFHYVYGLLHDPLYRGAIANFW